MWQDFRKRSHAVLLDPMVSYAGCDPTKPAKNAFHR